jgi:hypothetical protein
MEKRLSGMAKDVGEIAASHHLLGRRGWGSKKRSVSRGRKSLILKDGDPHQHDTEAGR